MRTEKITKKIIEEITVFEKGDTVFIRGEYYTNLGQYQNQKRDIWVKHTGGYYAGPHTRTNDSQRFRFDPIDFSFEIVYQEGN